MRRALVLTDDAARHPFRASLAPHICRIDETSVETRRVAGLSGDDFRQFLTAYCACLVGVATFIA